MVRPRPALPPRVLARQPGLTGSPGHHARSLPGSLGQIASPRPVSAAAPPDASGQAPGGIRNPSPSLSGGSLACDVNQAVSSAARAAAVNAINTQPGPAGGEGRLAEIYGRHAPDVPVLLLAGEQTWTMHHHDNPRWACKLAEIQGTCG